MSYRERDADMVFHFWYMNILLQAVTPPNTMQVPSFPAPMPTAAAVAAAAVTAKITAMDAVVPVSKSDSFVWLWWAVSVPLIMDVACMFMTQTKPAQLMLPQIWKRKSRNSEKMTHRYFIYAWRYLLWFHFFAEWQYTKQYVSTTAPRCWNTDSSIACLIVITKSLQKHELTSKGLQW